MDELDIPTPIPQHKELLASMAESGMMPGPLIAALVDVFFDDVSIDDKRFLAGPIVVHGNGWQNDIPKWMFEQAHQERALIVLGKLPGHLVGPTEIAAVMYPAIMAAPMGHDMSELYLWATVNALVRRSKIDTIENAWSMLDHRPVLDKDVIERNGRLWHSYWPLCHEIRRKVIQLGKDRVPNARERAQARKAEAAEAKVAAPAKETPQLSFDDYASLK